MVGRWVHLLYLVWHLVAVVVVAVVLPVAAERLELEPGGVFSVIWPTTTG